MTEHKFTDEEVIKALEHCESSCSSEACVGCPFDEKGACTEAENALAIFALDLINRQKAEIKSLEDTLCGKLSASAAFAIKDMDRKGKEVVREIKAEAIKEFAQRLKTYYRNLDKTAGGLVEYHIDQIAKEFLERGAADSQDNH